jgi:hypothetical protein
MNRNLFLFMALLVLVGSIIPSSVFASSHREAPFITRHPKVDGTDFYMFRSYEPGRDAFVVLIANYQPLQDAYGGPNFYDMDPDALYEIHVDNDGDAVENLTFQFRFTNTVSGILVDSGDGTLTAVPVINVGSVAGGDFPAGTLNVRQTYTCQVVFGDRRSGNNFNVSEVGTNLTVFEKPVDNIGQKSISDYSNYSRSTLFVHDVNFPNSTSGTAQGRMFVGQRDEPFFVNLGEVFDLINIASPAAEVDADDEFDTIFDKSVTSIVLEVPISYLTNGSEPVIGAWTTASLRQGRLINPSPFGANNASVEGGAWTQVSRLGHPLVNEVIIGLPDKDRFNTSEPVNDIQFLQYVTDPSLPAIIDILFPILPGHATNPRNDLVTVFLTGIDAIIFNQPANVVASEMLRLNTSTLVTPLASQNPLGVIGGDVAGFPNGRRPIDDVVDIELRVAYGLLAGTLDATSISGDVVTELTDGVRTHTFLSQSGILTTGYLSVFPFLADPVPPSTIP